MLKRITRIARGYGAGQLTSIRLQYEYARRLAAKWRVTGAYEGSEMATHLAWLLENEVVCMKRDRERHIQWLTTGRNLWRKAS